MLVGVVGPSGAGKDTLMAGARAALAGEPRFHFIQRSITRPAEAGGEDHRALSRAAFEAERAAGCFALWWEAHGLLYGIPADLPSGAVNIANLSRTVLAAAAARMPLLVLEITAPPAVLAARLAARGREREADIAARLARQAPLPEGLAVVRVLNDGPVEQGVERVVAALRAIP
ncbi:phosphonate metabolism protein/1,5-bisphosphokinase (PRPP-forming) PhnN [Belnapia sp. T6]|uniref:Ribose 1,5-bisphosphate phosphokinase PhnN n=2 Tax=Belnapia mucosa TaxID=2804532 RepID=A0ABS1V8D1_9PROT|nr:phosphonate metabolism protein/1,5-bisphosphokinase (PRPP-forming) PhnN [Belnapia mucosa]